MLGLLLVDSEPVKVATFSEGVDLLLLALDDVVSDFEHGTLVLEVLEDLGVHLQVHLENFTKHRVEGVVEHSGLILTV